LLAFEAAERESDPGARAGHLTFVVVGAGPTGVELAGALAEIARYTLDRNFRSFDPKSARVLLVEGGERVLPSYPEPLPARALRSLERIGVTVLTGAQVTAVDGAGVELLRGGARERIAARVVLWAAGVAGSPLGKALASATGCALDKAGRVIVQPELSVPGHPEILVIGDLAHCLDAAGKPLPGVAPVAMQQGRYAARLIQARLSGGGLPPFRYHDKGSMATIGRAAAVADLGFVRFGGYPAWLAWLFIHLMYIVEFDNRVLVFVQWAWSYLTRNRSARLITHARWPS
jgi:NADH dehydrogenase